MVIQMTASPVLAGGAAAGGDDERRLRGRWLSLARVICLGVSLVAVVIWVWGLPLRYAQLGTLCTGALANCGDQQVTPDLFQRFTAAGVPLSFYSAYFGTVEILYALAHLVMGALLFWRKSETPIGLLTAVLLITFGVAQTDATAVAAAVPALAALANLLDPFSFICLALFLYLFPDGRFAPRWTRWVVLAWIPLFLVVATVAADAIVPVLFSFLFVSLGVQVYRYRQVSSPAQRQQTKWVVFGVLLGLLGSGGIIVAGLLFSPAQVFGLGDCSRRIHSFMSSARVFRCRLAGLFCARGCGTLMPLSIRHWCMVGFQCYWARSTRAWSLAWRAWPGW